LVIFRHYKQKGVASSNIWTLCVVNRTTGNRKARLGQFKMLCCSATGIFLLIQVCVIYLSSL